MSDPIHVDVPHRNREHNPMTDKFNMLRFDHLEFTCCDAYSTMKILKRGLGMELIGESKKETGNHSYVSYVLNTSEMKYVVTAPLLSEFKHPTDKPPLASYDAEKAKNFFTRHGTGVSAVGIEVADAREAYQVATANGAPGITAPFEIEDKDGGKVIISEIDMYSDDSSIPSHKSLTVLRFIQKINYTGPFIPGYRAVKDPHPLNYGVNRIDHVVGNVYDLEKITSQAKKWLGLHTFSKFTKEDINTPWTALNSEVLANNQETILLPINEHAEGKKESQILEYLKSYNGPGVQHLALKSSNIFATVKAMKENSDFGFEFMTTPRSYYEQPNIMKFLKEQMTEEEADAVIELNILIDLDSEGLLLQIFTRPLFDRPTIFVEIIQRKCGGETIDIPGCGGFGNGNFKALFEAIERMQEERGGLIDA